MNCHFCNRDVTIPCDAKEAPDCPNLFAPEKKERKLIPIKEYEKRKDDKRIDE